MAITPVSILARDAAKDVTLTIEVKGLREMKIRLCVATLIVRFGVWVAGMNCKVKEME